MRRRRHLTLVTSPPPDADVIVVGDAACCMPVVVLRDGRVAVHHEGDHPPDDLAIDRALAQHRGEHMPDKYGPQDRKIAGATAAAWAKHQRAIADARDALIAAWSPTATDDHSPQPPDPKDAS